MNNNKYGVQFCDADRIEIRYYLVNGCCNDVELDFIFFNGNHSKSFTVDNQTGVDLSRALRDLEGWYVEEENEIDFSNPDAIVQVFMEFWDYGA